MDSPQFYLTTHHPSWLWNPAANFPLFVSHRALSRVRTLQRSTGGWALDSGGFTELSAYGTWQTSPADYVRAVARYDREIGQLEWAAPQDWMCEPEVIHGGGPKRYPGTHLSVAEHQRRTVGNFLQLCELWPGESDEECPFMPVLQGWEPDDYFRCADLYTAAGIGLECYPVVGLGSVCRRQGTGVVSRVVHALTPRLALHGFGIKTRGLRDFAHLLESADSLSWSLDAYYSPPLPGHSHKSCSNCIEYAVRWCTRLLDSLADVVGRGHQGDLFAPDPEPCPVCGQYHVPVPAGQSAPIPGQVRWAG